MQLQTLVHLVGEDCCRIQSESESGIVPLLSSPDVSITDNMSRNRGLSELNLSSKTKLWKKLL